MTAVAKAYRDDYYTQPVAYELGRLSMPTLLLIEQTGEGAGESVSGQMEFRPTTQP